MTWTYSTADLATSAKDQVRLLIGDTLSVDPQLQDEEIVQFISARSSIYGAAGDCCRSLASKFSRSVTQKAGTNTLNFSDMSKAYLKMAIGFDAKALASGAGTPYAGGISQSDKDGQVSNDDRVAPQFNLGMEDNNTIPISGTGNEVI